MVEFAWKWNDDEMNKNIGKIFFNQYSEKKNKINKTKKKLKNIILVTVKPTLNLLLLR